MNPPPPPPPAALFLPSHNPNLPPPPSLSTALSKLTSLLHLSATSLRSLPTPIAAAAASPPFLPCPSNPNHRLPPSSLFSHYLNCPSPLPLQNRVSATNFFYRNCPSPVTPPIQPPPSLNLPRVLHTDEDDKIKSVPVDFVRFLPSEIWAIRCETEAWGRDLPAAYSSRVLRAVLRLRDCNLLNLNGWIVASSVWHGVAIDFAMRDHVVVLVRLCLKAVVREAFSLFGDGESMSRSFECPVLVEVATWLALQFGVLYGEVNGKFFAVDVLKECVVESALRASCFPLDEKEETKRDEGEKMKGDTVGNSKIFVSNVEAAVAALHERSLIEGKIKALRSSRPVTAFERNMDHTYVSKIAAEERLKRPDYRPIIEHDGFLWQRSSNQDSNKVKTREELLAEERDYKRRRMSYRGKKSKRNTLEVTRDIIEEYMEEIKLAGGIGDMSKTVEKTEALASENMNTHASATSDSKSRRTSEILEENKNRSLDYKKDLHTFHDAKNFEDDFSRPRRDSSWDRGRKDADRSVEKNRHDRDDYSVRRDGRSRQRRSESRERKYDKRNRDERERNSRERERDEHERTSRKREIYEDYGENRDRERSKTVSARRERDVGNGSHGDMKERKMNRNNRSSGREYHKFDDRYDPAESRDSYEDDF